MTKKTVAKRHFYLTKYFQLTGAIAIAVAIIAVIIVGQRQSWWQSPSAPSDPQEVIVGEIYSSETLIPKNNLNLAGYLSRATNTGSLRPVGMGLVFDPGHVVTAAHVIGAQHGYYYFYNPVLSWQLLQDFETYVERDLAFGTFADLESFPVPYNTLELASDVVEDETVAMWIKSDETGRLQKIGGVVVQAQKVITLQQTWGEVQVGSLEVVAVRAENNLGDSGSPVFNQTGAVIGLIVGVDLADETLTYIGRL